MEKEINALVSALMDSSVYLSQLESRFSSSADEGIAFIPGDARELKSRIKDVLMVLGRDEEFWINISAKA